MSKENRDDPPYVSKELCDAYRQVMIEKIEGLKKAIYVSAATVGVIVTIVNVIIALTRL